MHNDIKELGAVFDLVSDDDLDNQTLEVISQNFKNIQKKKDVQVFAAFLVMLYQVEEPRLFRGRAFCIFFLLWEIYREPNFFKNCPYLKMFCQALNILSSRDEPVHDQFRQPKSVYDISPLPFQERNFLLSLLMEQRPQVIREDMKRTIYSILTRSLTNSDHNIDLTSVTKSFELANKIQTNPQARLAIPNYMMIPRRDYAYVSQFHLQGSYKPSEAFRISSGEEKRALKESLIQLFLSTCVPCDSLTELSSTASYFLPTCPRSEPPPLFSACTREELVWLEASVQNFELAWDYSLVANIESFIQEDVYLKDTLDQLHSVALVAEQAENVKRLFQTIALNPYLVKDYEIEASWVANMVELNTNEALDFMILIGNLRHCSADQKEGPEEVKLSKITVSMYRSKEGEPSSEQQEPAEHRELCNYIYDLFEKMLDQLIHMRISINAIEVLNHLHKYVVIPPNHFLEYAKSGVEHLQSETDRQLQSRLIRVWCIFLQSLIRNRFLDYDEVLPVLEQFCVDFNTQKEATNLFRLLKSMQDNSNREKDPLKK